MEDDSYRFRKSQFDHRQLNTQFQGNPRNRGKFCSSFLLKFLLIALFLSLLPLFPSEPPEFVSHTVFAHTWELFRLLIVGIALSYGLFCCRKSPQISPKPPISQPYVANILHHSSIFDYENENPSGIFEKNAMSTQSCNLSHYRTEPYVVVGRESCKNRDERPLGLPVRSLRSRIVDSDSDSNSDGGEEECVSECESDSSGKSSYSNSSSIPRSGKAENLDGNVGNSSPISWKSRSMRVGFMADNGNVGGKSGLKQRSQSSRLPMQESCQKNYGFCSWLPESPNMPHHHNTNPVWIPPLCSSVNMEMENTWRGNTFGMPFSDFSTQRNDFTTMMGVLPHLEEGNVSLEKHNFYVPSTAGPPSMPATSSDFPLRSRKYSYENLGLGLSSNFQNMNMGGEKSDLFMPQSGAPPSMSPPMNDFASRSGNYSLENVGLGLSSNLENMNMGCDKPDLFMPPAAAPPSMSPHMNDFASRSGNYSLENVGLGENMTTSGNKPDHFVPPTGVPLSISPPMNDFASRSGNYSHENVSLGQSSNSENRNMGGDITFIPPVAVPSSVSVPEKGFASSIRPSRSRKPNHEIRNRNLGKSPNLENGTLGGEKTNSSIPSAEKDFTLSIKRSRSRRINPETSLKKDEQGSEKDNVGNFVEGNDSSTRDEFDSLVNDSSLKKDEQRPIPTRWDDDCFVMPSSENNDMENLGEKDISHGLVDSSEPASSTDSSSRRSSNEQGSQQVEVEGNVTLSASTNSSEIEDLGRVNESYKPSTPSPPPAPPRVQPQRNDFTSSVESSSNALVKGSLLDDDQGSPPTTPGRGKALLRTSHSRRFSCGSFFDRDQRRSFKDEAKEVKYGRGGKCGWDCFNLDVKPTLTKSALKGKSVRTIRPRESPQAQKNDHVEQKLERKGENAGMVVIQIGISEKRSNSNSNGASGGTSIIVGLNSQENNSKGKATALSDVKEEETDSEEIDKKAGEFIAKFKEQIRLQKVAARAESSRQQQ